jgi:hypothetical protein
MVCVSLANDHDEQSGYVFPPLEVPLTLGSLGYQFKDETLAVGGDRASFGSLRRGVPSRSQTLLTRVGQIVGSWSATCHLLLGGASTLRQTPNLGK